MKHTLTIEHIIALLTITMSKYFCNFAIKTKSNLTYLTTSEKDLLLSDNYG